MKISKKIRSKEDSAEQEKKEIITMAKSRELQKQEIDLLLQELGEELLTRTSSPIRVLLVGGAYMALVTGVRRSTQDVDVFPLNFPNSARPDARTKMVLTAIKAVASRNGLKSDWFNDSVSGILGDLQPAEDKLQVWRSYGGLEVFVAPPDFVLVTKLIGYRDKDYNDVKALFDQIGVDQRNQAIAILETYGIDEEIQREYFVNDALDNFFDE